MAGRGWWFGLGECRRFRVGGRGWGSGGGMRCMAVCRTGSERLTRLRRRVAAAPQGCAMSPPPHKVAFSAIFSVIFSAMFSAMFSAIFNGIFSAIFSAD